MHIEDTIRHQMEERRAIESEMQELIAYLTQPGFPGITGRLVDSEGFPLAHLDIYGVRNARNRLARLQTDYKALMTQIELSLHELHSLQHVSNGSSSLHAEAHRPDALPPQDISHPLPSQDISDSLPLQDASHSFPSQDTSVPQSASSAPQAMEPSEGQSHSYQNSMVNGDADIAHSASHSNHSITMRPFAVVDQVYPNSPAAAAGLQVNDQLLQVGSLSLIPLEILNSRNMDTRRSGSSSQDSNQSICQNGYVTVDEVLEKLPSEVLQHRCNEMRVDVLRNDTFVQLTLIPDVWGGIGLLGCHIMPC